MIRVVLVDDHALFRSGVKAELGDAVEVVGEAGDGEEAVTRAREARPQIVFLDIEMPGVNGIEACRRLRSEPTTADATIVMLTGETGATAERSAQAAGADLFLTKPFSPLHLLQLVDRIGGSRPAG